MSRGIEWTAGPNAADLDAFLARLSRVGSLRSAGTRNQEIAALRALGRFAVDELGWPRSPLCDTPFLREPKREAAVLTADELRRLFLVVAAGPDDVEKTRNLAIVALLSQAGLRVGELASLDLGQVELGAALLVAVRGKGGTVHNVPLNAPAVTLLAAWLQTRAKVARPNETAVFVSSRGTRISVRTIQKLFVGLRRGIGTAKKLSPHTCRHSTATLCLTLGVDVATVSEVLRHSRLDTTLVYLHFLDERRRDAIRRLGTTVPPEVIGWPTPTASRHKPSEKSLDVQDDKDELDHAA